LIAFGEYFYEKDDSLNSEILIDMDDEELSGVESTQPDHEELVGENFAFKVQKSTHFQID
jgi:hypothetical protein